MRLLFTVCLALGLSVPGFAAKLPKALDIAVYAASEFDAATTYNALQNCPTCYETNPMVRPFASNPAIFVVLGGSAVGINYTARRLRRAGHGRMALIVQTAAVGLHILAGANNLRKAER